MCTPRRETLSRGNLCSVQTSARLRGRIQGEDVLVSACIGLQHSGTEHMEHQCASFASTGNRRRLSVRDKFLTMRGRAMVIESLGETSAELSAHTYWGGMCLKAA